MATMEEEQFEEACRNQELPGVALLSCNSSGIVQRIDLESASNS